MLMCKFNKICKVSVQENPQDSNQRSTRYMGKCSISMGRKIQHKAVTSSHHNIYNQCKSQSKSQGTHFMDISKLILKNQGRVKGSE